MWILFTTENLRALIFKSSKVFLKRPPDTDMFAQHLACTYWALHTINGAPSNYQAMQNKTRLRECLYI